MDISPMLCRADGCRLPALLASEYCRQHVPDPAAYVAEVSPRLGEAIGANLARIDLRQAVLLGANLS
ncbi:MAG TPA: hypothetical protein PK794_10605, partial [Armatimonadota bacterium]|nr:hypothetical protein [Armatimonadota bacterium]